MTDTTDIRKRIEARHEEVLGQPPRIPPLDPAGVIEQVQADTAHLRSGVAGKTDPLPVDQIPEIMFTMAHYPEVWRKIVDLSIQIQGANSVLPLRDRKLAILRTGWLCQAPFEFGEHVNQSRRAGLTEEEIERIVIGSSAPEWDDYERAILRAVEELHADAMVSDETWQELAKRLNEKQLIELLVLIGQYVATAYFQNSLRLRLEKNNAGLFAR